MSSPGGLDPLLAPALQMAERPVIGARRWAEELAARLTGELEALGKHVTGERHELSHGQLVNISEALAVCIISLCAYARGLVPRVASEQPNINVVVPD